MFSLAAGRGWTGHRTDPGPGPQRALSKDTLRQIGLSPRGREGRLRSYGAEFHAIPCRAALGAAKQG